MYVSVAPQIARKLKREKERRKKRAKRELRDSRVNYDVPFRSSWKCLTLTWNLYWFSFSEVAGISSQKFLLTCEPDGLT
jgi:hypothetical protein